jgi:hypothetical protein
MLADEGTAVSLPGVYDGPGVLSRARRITGGGDRSVMEVSVRIPGGAFGTPGPARGTVVTIDAGDGPQRYQLQHLLESGDRDGAFDDWLVTPERA